MQQTFLFIDQSWLLPLLILWIVIGSLMLGAIAFRKGIGEDFWGAMPIWIIGGLIIYFVAPQVMVDDPRDGEGSVLAIRGYGVFLLVGVLAGVGLAVHRSRQMGLNPDITLNLCFCLFATGIIGARLFYVVQYWPQFQVDGVVSFGKILNMTEGGLVVYGSIIGGAIGGIVYLLIYRLPVLPMLDILAPCMMIGLSIGRIGCLMNGCCWGGICDASWSIQFPEGVAPYARHVETGELFGMRAPPLTNENFESGREIVSVEDGSAAQSAGIKAGDKILRFEYNPTPSDGKLPDRIVYQLETDQGLREIVFDGQKIPEFSRPVHPTQIYSSINAFLVFLFLWLFFPLRTRDGQVLGLLMIVYPIGRFLLELIRSDEMGQFGTSLTISQWTSLGSILGGIAIIVVGQFYGRKTVAFGSSENQTDSMKNP